MGDLGQVVPVAFELRDKDSVRNAIRGSTVVVNLMGKHYETYNYKFDDVHVEGARRLAETAREEGVTHFVHVSTAMPLEKCKSKWLQSKQQGEDVVRKIYPDATIIRTTDMFGAEDRLVTRMAKNIMSSAPVVLSNFGEARMQPVSVNDVASLVAAAVRDPERYASQILELGGPDVLTTREFYDLICGFIQRTTLFVPLPTPVVEFGATLFNMRIPVASPYPVYGADTVMMETAETILDESKTGVLRFEDLNASAISVYSDVMKEAVRRFRRGGDRSSLFYVY